MKLGLSIAAAAMLGGALIAGFHLRPASAPSSASLSAPSSPAPASTDDAPDAAKALAKNLVRESVEVENAGAAPAPARTLVLRGLCLAAEDRRPLPGSVIGEGAPLLTAISAHELDGPSILSGERGEFMIEVAALPATRELWIECEGRCRERISLRQRIEAALRVAESEPAREIDLGEILLVRGREVRGVVRDPEGAPVPGAELLAYLPKRVPHGEVPVLGSAEVTLAARVDEHGRFAFRPHAPNGRYRLLLVQPESRELVSPQDFVLEDASDGTLELVVTVAPLPRITGRLKRADASPLPVGWRDGLVMLGKDGSRVPHTPTLDDDGGFYFVARRGERAPLYLEITGGSFAPLRLTRPIAWGTQGLEIEVVVTGFLRLSVVDAHTGAPIERFAAFCVSLDPHAPKSELQWPEQQRHAGGSLLLGGVPPGACALHVWVDAPGYYGTKEIRFEKQRDETPTFRVAFERRVSRAVVVTSSSGEPVADAELELFDVDSEIALALPIARARTDVSGGARIEAAPSGRSFRLQVRGPGFGFVLVEDVELGVDLPALAVMLPPAAKLSGRVEPPAIPGRGRFLVELHAASPRDGAPRRISALSRQEVGLDGAFRWDELAPGAWEVRLLLPRLDIVLAERALVLAPGEELDLGTLLPNDARCPALHVSVAWPEAPPRSYELVLQRQPQPYERSVSRDERFERVLSSEASATFDYLSGGSYALRIVLRAGSNQVELRYPELLSLEAGAPQEIRWEAQVRPLRFRALGPDGKALVNENLVVPVGRSVRCRTDALGFVELDHAPLEEISLVRLRHSADTALLAAGLRGDLGDLVFRSQR